MRRDKLCPADMPAVDTQAAGKPAAGKQAAEPEAVRDKQNRSAGMVVPKPAEPVLVLRVEQAEPEPEQAADQV